MDERSLKWQNRFEWPMVVAALLTIPMLVLEESPVGEPWSTLADVLNWGTWLAFVTELCVMLYVVPDRKRWAREHPIEVFVTIFTPPFLPATMQAARVLRLLRVTRVFRVHALRRILSLEGIRYATLLVVLTILVGGTSFAAIENRGLTAWDGVWFATETVTTVGYGDIVPATSAGRVLAMLIMFVGIGFVALLTAFVADRFIKPPAADDWDDEQGDEGGEDALATAPVQSQILGELRSISERLARVESELTGKK